MLTGVFSVKTLVRPLLSTKYASTRQSGAKKPIGGATVAS